MSDKDIYKSFQEWCDGLAMDLHAATYAEPMLVDAKRLRAALRAFAEFLSQCGLVVRLMTVGPSNLTNWRAKFLETSDEINLMNECKALAEQCGKMVESLQKYSDADKEVLRLPRQTCNRDLCGLSGQLRNQPRLDDKKCLIKRIA